MSSINPIETQVQAPASKGIKNALNKLGKNKKMTAQMEQIAGLTCANQVKDPAVLKEIVMRESMLGHFDFVRGINEYLAKNASKEIYKK